MFNKKILFVFSCMVLIVLFTSCSTQPKEVAQKKAAVVGVVNVKETEWNGMTCYEYIALRRPVLEKSAGVNDILEGVVANRNGEKIQNPKMPQKLETLAFMRQAQVKLAALRDQIEHKLSDEMQRCMYTQLQGGY